MKIDPIITRFLQTVSCTPSRIERTSADWGNRSYLRLWEGDTSKILMICKTEDTGADLEDFVGIDQWIRSIGLNAPELYHIDHEKGLILLEDYGDEYCEDYTLLSDCIHALQQAPAPTNLQQFLDSPVYIAHRRVIDWFVPCRLGKKNDPDHVEQYLTIWKNIESTLPTPQTAFAHMDFHPANFMNVIQEDGLKRCGILDFQDACIGPIAYDYTNLLKDIRKDVPQKIIDQILEKATQGMSSEDTQNFMAWYKFLCVQFHFRIAGQVIKLSLVNGRDDLMVYLPRVMRYIQEELNDPMFTELKEFFDALNLDWNAEDLMIKNELIAPNAY